MREEAKITAWENLQKAKAEAAIRKLEVVFNSTYDIVVCVCVCIDRYVCMFSNVACNLQNILFSLSS